MNMQNTINHMNLMGLIPVQDNTRRVRSYTRPQYPQQNHCVRFIYVGAPVYHCKKKRCMGFPLPLIFSVWMCKRIQTTFQISKHFFVFFYQGTDQMQLILLILCISSVSEMKQKSLKDHVLFISK